MTFTRDVWQCQLYLGLLLVTNNGYSWQIETDLIFWVHSTIDTPPPPPPRRHNNICQYLQRKIFFVNHPTWGWRTAALWGENISEILYAYYQLSVLESNHMSGYQVSPSKDGILNIDVLLNSAWHICLVQSHSVLSHLCLGLILPHGHVIITWQHDNMTWHGWLPLTREGHVGPSLAQHSKHSQSRLDSGVKGNIRPIKVKYNL